MPRFTLRELFQMPESIRSQVSTQLQQAPKPRKYGNVPTERYGQKFDSKLEARCYEWLQARKAAGEVVLILRQVRFDLPGGVIARIDYAVLLSNGVGKDAVEFIDAKGKLTQVAANKYKQIRELYGVVVKLWPRRD